MEQKKKYCLGYVPGVFDLFHIGHLNLLRRAKEQSEYLLAGVLSDELVEYFKGKKPYIQFEERIAIVGAIKEVDEVVKVDFSNTVKMDAWKLYHYDAYFSGNDHKDEWEEERRELQELGADIVFLPYTKSISSTMIKEQMQQAKIRKRLYLFGAGRIGQRILKNGIMNVRNDQWEIAGFLDNQPEKHLTRIQEVPVYRPEDLLTLETEGEFSVMISMKDTEAAVKHLKALNLEEKIVKDWKNSGIDL